ncbi:rhodanese-like domain-containing protein [Micromonospora sp. C95]|uniref:rhodanese-like domain-containing protein n=1 Tax=Micromonospora sp. C95 TaxID=2824882 RepID=UPI0027DDD2E8|nr:rhodanese-like domain-containing protein [Micromonospora sp. C95]
MRRGDNPPAGSRGIDEILAAARGRLRRLAPVDAHAAQRAGAVLVDIRPMAQRSACGEIPGAVVIERNVLEWRLDPRSDARLDLADGYDLAVVVVCQEGYTSSLAAAALQDLGLWRATDVVGGFAAWQADGLPVEHLHQGPVGRRGDPG